MTAERTLKDAAQAPAVEPIDVALIEDDSGTRASLREIIESAADCRCVGEFRSVAEAIAGIPTVAPKVVLVDVNLPDGTGVDCVRRLAPTMPSTGRPAFRWKSSMARSTSSSCTLCLLAGASASRVLFCGVDDTTAGGSLTVPRGITIKFAVKIGKRANDRRERRTLYFLILRRLRSAKLSICENCFSGLSLHLKASLKNMHPVHSMSPYSLGATDILAYCHKKSMVIPLFLSLSNQKYPYFIRVFLTFKFDKISKNMLNNSHVDTFLECF